MYKYRIEDNYIYEKIITIVLKLLLLSVPLFVNKYVYDFRVNQEAGIEIFAVILFAAWLKKIINTEKYSHLKTNLNLLLTLFGAVIALSILLVSDNRMVSLRESLIFFSYFLVFFIFVNNIDNNNTFNSFIRLFFIISSLISIYTILQYYGIDPYLSDLHSLTSTIGQKNWISNYLAMIFPIIFSYFLLEQTKKNKIIYFILLSILYVTLMICQSRGIWISISLTVILGIYIIYKFIFYEIFKRNKKWLFLLLITFLIITIIYSTDNLLNKSAITVTQRATSTFDQQDPSINMHILKWKITFEMIKEKPLLGSGIGTFKMNYLNYQAEFLRKNPGYIKYSVKAREAHNEYLQIWAELGIIGLGLFILIFYFFYKTIFNFYKSNKNIKDKTIMLGLVMGITCFLIHCLFSFPLHVPALGITFFAIIGLTVVFMRKTDLYKVGSNNCIKKVKLINKKIKIVLTILIFIFLIGAVDLLVLKPYIAEMHYFNGMRYNVDDNYTKALPYFENAVSLDPYNGRILNALGSTYYNLNVLEKAEETLQKAKKYITDVNIFYNLGLVYSQTGEYQKAEKEFKNAIYFDPKNFKTYHNLGLLYFSQENYDKAVEQWNKILEIEPNFANKYIVLNNLGIVYSKKEMPDKAMECFLEALQLVPEGDPIEKEIEEEINKIYKSKLEN